MDVPRGIHQHQVVWQAFSLNTLEQVCLLTAVEQSFRCMSRTRQAKCFQHEYKVSTDRSVECLGITS